MDGSAVSAALRERLGPEATGDLLDVLEAARREWKGEVIEVSAERFERRLVEEVSKLRLEIVQGDAALRQEMTSLGASLRQETTSLGASLRQEMASLGVGLRQEMASLEMGLRQEMASLEMGLRQEMASLGMGLRQEMSAGRFDLLKWSFLFWMGQVVAVAGILGVMLRVFRS